MTSLQADSIDLDFILSHFEEPLFPRTISTNKTENRQVEVKTRQAALNLFDYARSLDCKIRAFPSYLQWKGLNRQPPNLIFIDIDLLGFTSKVALDRCVRRTLRNIKKKLDNAHPTVLWSGGGYHIIQPTRAFLLEDYEVFADNFEHPSRTFLQFAEQYFTNKKADPIHTFTLSFKNCMLRVPGSYNSKYVQFNDKGEIVHIPAEAEVRIVQKWNGIRPVINWLLRDFRRYLIQKKVEIKLEKRVREKKHGRYKVQDNQKTKINWIEVLLETPIEDYRKFVVWRILAPYLVNGRKMTYNDAFVTIEHWLTKCNSLCRLNFKADYRMQRDLNSAKRVGYYPIRLDKLKMENRALYDLMRGK